MKWVLARYYKGQNFMEYVKNNKGEASLVEEGGLQFGTFVEAEKFKKDNLAGLERPFYILSTPTIDRTFL